MSTRPQYETGTPLALLEEAQSSAQHDAFKYGTLPNPYLPKHMQLTQIVPESGGHTPKSPLHIEGVNKYQFEDIKGEPVTRQSGYATLTEPHKPRYWAEGRNPEEALAAVLEELNQVGPRVGQAVAPLPFEKNWEQKAIQQAIATAVEQESPGLAMTMGREQLRRYPHLYRPEKEKERRGMLQAYDQRLRNQLSKAGKKHGLSPGFTRLDRSDVARYAVRPPGARPGEAGLSVGEGLKRGRNPYKKAVLGSERVHYLPFNEGLIKEAKGWLKYGLPLSLLPAAVIPEDEENAPTY